MEVFAGTRGTHSPKYLIVGECFTIADSRHGKAFMSSGAKMLEQMLTTSGVNLSECLFTNVVNAPSPTKDMRGFFHKTTSPEAKAMTPYKGLYPKPEVLEGIERLERLIEVTQPELIITLGNYPLWALTDEYKIGNSSNPSGYKVPTGIGSYRGSHLHHTKTNTPLLPTYHPAAVRRNQPWLYQMSHDLKVRIKKFQEGKWEEPEKNFTVRPGFDHTVNFLTNLLRRLEQETVTLAIDIETRAYNISCIGFAWSKTEAFCIPLMCVEREDGYWSLEEEMEIIRLFQKILPHPNLRAIGQNFTFDVQHIWNSWGIKMNIYFDTMIGQHLIYPGTELNLVNLSSMYCDYHRYWKDDSKFMSNNTDEDTLWVYNCRDCVITLEVAEAIQSAIAFYDLTEQWEYQIDQLNGIVDMMIRGVLIDQEAKHMMTYELEAAREEYVKKLEKLLPETVYPRKPKASPWYTSPAQQKEIFNEVFGMKRYWNKQKRAYTVDDAALAHYGKAEPLLAELCETLRQFRSIKTYKTFTDMKLGPDGRMRSSFTPTASTFRWKSSADVFGNGGNLQNLPKGQEA